MSGFKIGGISLGKSTKKYLRNTDFDNNTTMDFGFCQPLFCQFLLPDSNISVSAKQLVRLAPMPVPSFARVSLVNKFVFVPWSDLCGYYEAMLSNMPYNGSVVPTQLPFCYNAYLAKCLLLGVFGSYCTFYVSKTSSVPAKFDLCTGADLTTANQQLTSLWSKELEQHSSKMTVAFDYKQSSSLAVSPNNADYLFQFASGSSVYLAAFRYSTRAKHLRSVLIGLGYSLASEDWTKVNALPIFAYYKAWYDTYAPKRSVAWTDTSVFKFIKGVSDNYLPDVCSNGDFYNVVLKSVSDCYYVSNDDFVSVHRPSLDTVSLGAFPYVNYGGTSSQTPPLSTSEQPNVQVSSINLIALDVVKRLTRFVNKDSVIGQKMSTWVRNHFNAQVANSLYEDVYQVKTDILPLQINDVFSTADTADTSSQQGERLGSYAGKGIGFGDTGCRFHSDKHGYLLCISAIVPKSGYFQGNDTSLYGLDRFTLPSADFDALGMEVTPFGFVAGDLGYANLLPSSPDKIDYSSGFGFVPRFSGYKFKKNIVNGDMSRRSLIDSMCPYYLDRILQSGDILFNSLENNSYTLIRNFVPSIPKASEQWRYPTRYPWLGDFDRIFYNDDVYHGSDSNSSAEFTDVDSRPSRPDNFIVQSLFTMKVQDVLKPLSLSYDTFDEDSDNTSTEVNPE
uniref:Major capsid protein n=1 Tax=Microviridae sp. ctiu24 TaxID=2826742 RepID=A0A8S5LYE3_9VIRU|nr:MAG TPA: Major capsid protein [Microviridae sp. ctiu24]